MPSSPEVSQRPPDHEDTYDPDAALQALLRPRQREIDREAQDQEQGREQFELWIEDNQQLLQSRIVAKMRERHTEHQH